MHIIRALTWVEKFIQYLVGLMASGDKGEKKTHASENEDEEEVNIEKEDDAKK